MDWVAHYLIRRREKTVSVPYLYRTTLTIYIAAASFYKARPGKWKAIGGVGARAGATKNDRR